MTAGPAAVLGGAELFDGLSPAELADVAALMRPRRLDAGEEICRAADRGETLFVIAEGIANVLGDEGPEPRVRLRRGDVVGEMSLVTGEPRTATVVASLPTTVLELDREGFSAVVARHPSVLANLSRILSRRLAEANVRQERRSRRGEAVAVVLEQGSGPDLAAVEAAARAASARPVAVLDPAEPEESVLARLDDLLAEHGTVLAPVLLAGDGRPHVLDHVDRVVSPPPDVDLGWLGRHLTRTKLGVALGAGGAKGYASIGALQVIAGAGYTVDYVAGSSMGAMVGAWLALGQSPAELEETMRASFTPDAVEEIFKLSLSGSSTGVDRMAAICRETTGGGTFADLLLPLVVMTVDMGTKQPAPLTEGPLWDALLAATAVAGIFPPVEREGRRLVDGLALVPVPSQAVAEAGADVTVAVNLMSRDTLPAWPGVEGPVEEPAAGRVRILDTLLEVMDLAQLDASVRHADLADVVVTPRFGPSTWRDFHLADLFLAAGREAAEEALPELRAIARPAGR